MKTEQCKHSDQGSAHSQEDHRGHLFCRFGTKYICKASHLRRLRDKLGFRRTTTKYCHMIRDANKEKRFAFCTRMIENNEDFSQCIFTDESTIQIDCSVKHCYVKEGDYFSRLRLRAKHPAKLHLWGGISMRGATELAIFPR
ncbi:hypothetical protein COOONC_08257 [Cooperia oncophora]